jgi:hypothetical protein
MADFNITVTNSVNCFGGWLTTKWGDADFPWGTAKWGGKNTDLITYIIHVLPSETLTPADSIDGHSAVHLVSETLTPTEALSNETLRDGSGYAYVFPSQATNAEDRDDTTWSSAAAGSDPFTSASVASTTWS